MFCDLVDSTVLSQRLDPEELREVLRGFQRAAAASIGEFGGHVARYMGDGLLVYFGYPQAHEDDARRAVSAGLGIVRAVKNLAERYAFDSRIELHVRVGVHTGLVVLGEMGSGERVERGDIVGETPNIAARLQNEASPDSLIISEATYRLVQGYFHCEPVGARLLKGSSAPINCYQVVGQTGVQTRLEVAAAKGLTPFVGRRQELELLRQFWDEAGEGKSHVVVVSGEAGIGKSRLLMELKSYVRERDHATVELRCSHLHQNTALYPIIDQAERIFQFAPGDSQETKTEKMIAGLGRFGVPMEDAVPHFASLFSLPVPPGYPTAEVSPERQKQRTFDFSLQMLITEAARHPVLLVVEDLHWVDPTTLELLGQLNEKLEDMQLMVVMTCRPEFAIPWREGPKLTVVTLGRLASDQARAIIEGTVGGKPLPSEIVSEIASRTEGVPLFLEELTSMVVESGLVEDMGDHYRSSGPLAPYAIPESLHDSLMARLDHMARVKDVAQLAATLGREFRYELIRAVSPLSESELQEALNELTTHGIVYPIGSRPNLRYAFKHALIQEAAYQSLLRSTRQTFHRNVVTVIETNFPDLAQNEPEVMAYHYMEAGFNERAIGYWQRAADRAMQKSANLEARTHLNNALALVAQLPESPERKRQELALRMALGPIIAAVKGMSDSEMRETFARAREISRELGDGPELMPVLWGLWLYNIVKADYGEAMDIASQCLKIAQEHDRPELFGPAHLALATTLIWQGKFTDARGHAARGLSYYDRERDKGSAWVYGLDTATGCLIDLARTSWFMGYPDEALRRIREAVEHTRRIDHAFSLGEALCFAAAVHLLRGEGESALQFGEEASAVSDKYSLPQWTAAGKIASGWSKIDLGMPTEGIGDLQQGVTMWKAIESGAALPWFLALLAEGYIKVHEPSKALDALDEAQRLIDHTGEGFYAAEVQRLRGEVHRLTGDAVAAEQAYMESLRLARAQQALSLELRAAMGIGRIWMESRPEEALALIKPVIGRFTEGYETRDLKDAMEMLTVLSAAVPQTGPPN